MRCLGVPMTSVIHKETEYPLRSLDVQSKTVELCSFNRIQVLSQ